MNLEWEYFYHKLIRKGKNQNNKKNEYKFCLLSDTQKYTNFCLYFGFLNVKGNYVKTIMSNKTASR